MRYRIEYSPDTTGHMMVLTKRQQVTVLDAVRTQLTRQPNVETGNRKMMRPNPVAPWELRVGKLRVYYDVQETPESVVFIRAIGVKTRNVVQIEGHEIKL